MADIVDKATRSRMMSSIKSKDTGVEVLIRKALYARGYRYRLHRKNLPGKPDLALGKHQVAVFINGCFWHYHGCSLFKMPDTRHLWWKNKLTGNRERDRRNINALLEMGWRVCIIWECAFRGGKKNRPERISNIVNAFEEWFEGNGLIVEIDSGTGTA
jgi:DNA mismatch endonuclease (patch repair protein)